MLIYSVIYIYIIKRKVKVIYNVINRKVKVIMKMKEVVIMKMKEVVKKDSHIELVGHTEKVNLRHLLHAVDKASNIKGFILVLKLGRDVTKSPK